MLQGGLADASLAVEQEAIICQRALDLGDEIAPAEVHIRPDDPAGDVGVELLGNGALDLTLSAQLIDTKSQWRASENYSCEGILPPRALDMECDLCWPLGIDEIPIHCQHLERVVPPWEIQILHAPVVCVLPLIVAL